MQLKIKPLSSRGDTLVEVLIALAVMGSALGIGYAAASNSLTGTEQAQEHSVALKLAQSQAELLLANNTGDAIYTGNPYCFSSAGAITTGFTASPPASANNDNLSEYPAACQQSSMYDVAISYGGSPNDIFTITVRWPAINGHGNDNVELDYKIHKAVAP